MPCVLWNQYAFLVWLICRYFSKFVDLEKTDITAQERLREAANIRGNSGRPGLTNKNECVSIHITRCWSPLEVLIQWLSHLVVLVIFWWKQWCKNCASRCCQILRQVNFDSLSPSFASDAPKAVSKSISAKSSPQPPGRTSSARPKEAIENVVGHSAYSGSSITGVMYVSKMTCPQMWRTQIRAGENFQ